MDRATYNLCIRERILVRIIADCCGHGYAFGVLGRVGGGPGRPFEPTNHHQIGTWVSPPDVEIALLTINARKRALKLKEAANGNNTGKVR
jgi:hypothetical protein